MQRIIVILFVLMLATVGSFADGDKYNEKEYEEAVKLEHKLYEGAEDPNWLLNTVKRCDSLYKVGERQKNYVVMAEALYLKSYVYIHSDEYNREMVSTMNKAREIVRNHNNMSIYFLYYMQYCEWLGHVDEKIVETKAMISEAEQYEGMHEYTAGGYQLLGNVYSESMCDYVTAAEMYSKAEELKKKFPELDRALLDLPLLQGVNYANLGMRDKAQQHIELFRHDNIDTPVGSPNEYVLLRMELVVAYALDDKKKVDTIFRQIVNHPIWVQVSPGEKAWVKMMGYTCTGRYAEAEKLIPDLMENDSECVNNYVYVRRLYEKWGHHSEALLYADKCRQFSDSVRRVSEQREFKSMDSRMMKITMDGEAERAHSRQMLIMLVSGAVIFLVVVTMMAFILYRRRRHARQLMLKNQELVAARDEAVKAGEMKSEFIRNMTHELRTPIHQINGFASVLSYGAEELDVDTLNDITTNINDASTSLTSFIDNIIYLASLDSDPNPPVIQEVSPARVLKAALTSVLRRPAEGVEIVQNVNVPDDLGLTTNEQMLHNALAVLIDNAIKFTAQGSITLSVSATDEDVSFVVEDTGCGVPEGMEEKIFQRFVKADDFVPGIGIGLAICKIVADSLGATITLDRSYTLGSRFILKMPREKK